VTCYFRHLQRIFDRAGVAVTSANKQAVDRAIHALVGVDYKNCSAVWREVKRRLADDEERFVEELRAAVARAE
jgi:hypothetical protein